MIKNIRLNKKEILSIDAIKVFYNNIILLKRDKLKKKAKLKKKNKIFNC